MLRTGRERMTFAKFPNGPEAAFSAVRMLLDSVFNFLCTSRHSCVGTERSLRIRLLHWRISLPLSLGTSSRVMGPSRPLRDLGRYRSHALLLSVIPHLISNHSVLAISPQTRNADIQVERPALSRSSCCDSLSRRRQTFPQCFEYGIGTTALLFLRPKYIFGPVLVRFLFRILKGHLPQGLLPRRKNLDSVRGMKELYYDRLSPGRKSAVSSASYLICENLW